MISRKYYRFNSRCNHHNILNYFNVVIFFLGYQGQNLKKNSVPFVFYCDVFSKLISYSLICGIIFRFIKRFKLFIHNLIYQRGTYHSEDRQIFASDEFLFSSILQIYKDSSIPIYSNKDDK